ncbi:MAG: hypothetical protein PUD80_01875 [Firmicutes bacterium]|nr:hypothetical protein [Bacillota bacterium]
MKEHRAPPGRSARELAIALLLLLLAVGCVTAATTAWLSIADYARVRSMNLDVTTGANLRFDLDPHPVLEDYVTTLKFRQIADRVQRDRGFDPAVTPLEPVTTDDYDRFTYEEGDEADPNGGDYLEFTLHFMSAKDMYVHLTSANSKDKQDGTSVTGNPPQLLQAMRIAFTVGDTTIIYTPGSAAAAANPGGAKLFDLPSADRMVLNDANQMFFLPANTNVPVKVQVWLEGTDNACDDELIGAEYSIQLRFVGADENHNLME